MPRGRTEGVENKNLTCLSEDPRESKIKNMKCLGGRPKRVENKNVTCLGEDLRESDIKT